MLASKIRNGPSHSWSSLWALWSLCKSTRSFWLNTACFNYFSLLVAKVSLFVSFDRFARSLDVVVVSRFPEFEKLFLCNCRGGRYC